MNLACPTPIASSVQIFYIQSLTFTVLVFYIKYFDCKVNSSQSSQLYRTSRSNSLFITILLASFIVTIIPVGYSIAEIKPSVACGPFRELKTIWSEMVDVIEGQSLWLVPVHQSVHAFNGKSYSGKLSRSIRQTVTNFYTSAEFS